MAESFHPFETHTVENQATPLVDYNVFSSNAALVEAVSREGAAWALQSLAEFGALLGKAETIELSALANRNIPTLKTFDRFGRRIDEVEFHPAYHELISIAVEQGIHSSSWASPRAGGHVARAAGAYLFSGIEAGVLCPITMTHASVPPLSKNPTLAGQWLPKIFSTKYDARFVPFQYKSGALVGMGMTEKQGGSDVRTNSTKAVLIDERTGEYSLVGHKWFFSAPMSDAFLVLAEATAGLSCFFVPRFLPDGERNAIRIQRLKEKLGNRSNASSEVEFCGAHGWLLGEPGRGIPTMIVMATYTRLDCGLGSAGLMRRALIEAIHHASERSAFQRKLTDQPLMQNLLADLSLESEAATLLMMRIAKSFDEKDDPNQGQFRRIATPCAKYWICKRGPEFAYEAMEVLGGNGYVEEAPLARIYREMPVNSIWEGSGNVMCLDVLRAISKNPDALDVVSQEWRSIEGANKDLDRFTSVLEEEILALADSESDGRRLSGMLALCLSAALMVKHAPPAMAELFCRSRLTNDGGNLYGTLPRSQVFQSIIERARVNCP